MNLGHHIGFLSLSRGIPFPASGSHLASRGRILPRGAAPLAQQFVPPRPQMSITLSCQPSAIRVLGSPTGKPHDQGQSDGPILTIDAHSTHLWALSHSLHPPDQPATRQTADGTPFASQVGQNSPRGLAPPRDGAIFGMTEREATMAEAPDQPTPPITPESWQWAFSFLREDVQDIRTDIRELRAETRQGLSEVSQRLGDRIDQSSQQLNARIDETTQQLIARIDETNQRLSTRIDETNQQLAESARSLVGSMQELDLRLSTRIDETNQRLSTRIDVSNEQLLRRIDTRFNWTITIVLAATGLMSGLMTALIKL